MKTSGSQKLKLNRKIAKLKSKSDAVIAKAGKDAKKLKINLIKHLKALETDLSKSKLNVMKQKT